ncbi:phospholipase A-2-activating protein [Drosophila sulfurigaster albostrigata]|uniref:phospholipase A-2-activating protein n=1 Tax=Drosophila sulfurigaster albostrigata TaxID=89887 RepID=UPI002D21E1E3|nr:phospholipase A-2-activating protein [Drosophila sulfurigaster albostrigata]
MEPTLDKYKLSCELLGHSLDVRAVAVGGKTNEGQMLLSGSRDKTTKIWKPIGNEYIESVTLKDHKNFIASVCYLPQEQWICTSSNDATISIYQQDAFVPLITLKGHESTVCALAGGLKPRSLISGSWDKTARVWLISETGDVTHIALQGHEAAVWAVATLQEQQKYVTGGADKCIYYWNAQGEKLRLLKGHTDCVRGLIPLPSNSLLSCGNDAVLRYWNEDGECVRELSGHTNYIYAMARNQQLGEQIVLSCGEDSTLRMWNVSTGKELGAPLLHPAISVWSVACLANGDIVTGCSDGVVRVFSQDPARQGKQQLVQSFEMAVATHKSQLNEEIGGVKKTDLPGPEALLTNGTREGQTKMVRETDGSVKCYSWELGKWNLVGDVTGATGGTQSNSGKKLHDGKEYDYVFNVDISDTEPPIKLPYNRGEDPWQAAQSFIHRHNLPQAYLDQVANFIVTNSKGGATVTSQANSGYQDPFTGGARYVPGSSQSNVQGGGNMDPFTGGSSYSTAASKQSSNVDVNFVRGSDKHFPVSSYRTFDTCDAGKVLDKMKEFNNKLTSTEGKVGDELLQAVIRLTDKSLALDPTTLEALMLLLKWPAGMLFPVLDILRLAVRHEAAFSLLQNSHNILSHIVPQLNAAAANQLMVCRCLANALTHAAGRQHIQAQLPQLVELVAGIRAGSPNLQIAIATFYLNVTIAQTQSVASSEVCHLVTSGVLELLKWAKDLEAWYRAMQAIGNLTTTACGQETIAQVVSVDSVMDKLRELTNTPQDENFAKVNVLGQALLAAF